jgi:predicted ATPase
VLKYLLESIPGAAVFLILTYRPEFVHTWGSKSYHSQVTLNRLSNRESLSMLYHLLGTENIDRDLEELVLEKTEGVPFFIEEFIRSLRDLNIIERKQQISPRKGNSESKHSFYDPGRDHGQSRLPA